MIAQYLATLKMTPKSNLLIDHQQKPDVLHPADIHQYKAVDLIIITTRKLQGTKPAGVEFISIDMA